MKAFTLALLAFASTVLAQEKYAPTHRLTWDEYAGTLSHWRKTYPKLVTLESRGMSGQTMPFFLLKITDRAVPNADKQVCLITTLPSAVARRALSR